MSIQTIDVTLAAALLREGEVVAIPTETVYGLAGSISVDDAVKKIFALKGRPSYHPLIIHLADINMLARYAASIPPYVENLLTQFCPGPLTFVLKRTEAVSPLVTGGQDTIGVRFPAHFVAQALIKEVGHALAAPSANRFGRISPTRPEHVFDEFGSDVKILDGGVCTVGIESTIIDATKSHQCTILRQGLVSLKDLQDAIGHLVEIKNQPSSDAPRVSGMLKKHYAPTKPTFLFSTPEELVDLKKHFGELSVLCFSRLPRHPNEYARALYHELRRADATDSSAIAIERPPPLPEWAALHDRLERASSALPEWDLLS